ncbi:MAG: hypothetical protein AABN34_10460 [Acidobacteriota bacterium]
MIGIYARYGLAYGAYEQVYNNILLSLPDAIITKAFAPILVLGQSVALSLGSLSASGARNLDNL